MQIETFAAGRVGKTPDTAYIQRELSRNLRERELLTKLLKLAIRKAALIDLERAANSGDTLQEVSDV